MPLSVYLGTGEEERNLQLHTCPLVSVMIEQHAWKSSIIIPSHVCVGGEGMRMGGCVLKVHYSTTTSHTVKFPKFGGN